MPEQAPDVAASVEMVPSIGCGESKRITKNLAISKAEIDNHPCRTERERLPETIRVGSVDNPISDTRRVSPVVKPSKQGTKHTYEQD